MILEVLRDFTDKNIAHIYNEVNSQKDKEIIKLELILKDLEKTFTLKNKYEKYTKKDKENEKYVDLLKKISDILENEEMIKDHKWSEDEKVLIRELDFLTGKPTVYLHNIEEYKAFHKDDNFYLNILLENELSKLNSEERLTMMKDLNIDITGIDTLVKFIFDQLSLQVFFTAGEKEVRAWTIKKDTMAIDAAGVIHTDFKDKFIKMDILSFDDFIKSKGWVNAKDKGLIQTVGKDHIMQDGDVIIVKHS